MGGISERHPSFTLLFTIHENRHDMYVLKTFMTDKIFNKIVIRLYPSIFYRVSPRDTKNEWKDVRTEEYIDVMS